MPEGEALCQTLFDTRAFKREIIKYRFNWQSVYNDASEVNGGSPKTGVYTKRQVKELFKEFNSVTVTKKRMGEFWEYKPYNTIKFPAAFNSCAKFFGLESWFGELANCC